VKNDNAAHQETLNSFDAHSQAAKKKDPSNKSVSMGRFDGI